MMRAAPFRGIPRLYAAASLKRPLRLSRCLWSARYSAALCRGLIEAPNDPLPHPPIPRGIPRLYAAASLKLVTVFAILREVGQYSAALCRGLIEAVPFGSDRFGSVRCIPRLYAAASLKLRDPLQAGDTQIVYSAALCRGLIEARRLRRAWRCPTSYSAALCRGLIEATCSVSEAGRRSRCIPRLYAAASLKLLRYGPRECGGRSVFRGFMPRPH